jgi:hypothetical protein
MKNPWSVLLGRERLRIVFWCYCVAGTAIVFALPDVDHPHAFIGMPLSFFVILVILQLAYLFWAHISLWTCAFNTQRRVWGYAARAYVALLVITISTWMLMPSTPRESKVVVEEVLRQ